MTVIVKEQARVCGLSVYRCLKSVSTFSNVHAHKRNGALLGYFRSKVQVPVAGVQFIKESVGFVKVWHDCESIIHVPFIKRESVSTLNEGLCEKTDPLDRQESGH